jgi:RNA polymerase sigma factor (sigma-70 family)
VAPSGSVANDAESRSEAAVQGTVRSVSPGWALELGRVYGDCRHDIHHFFYRRTQSSDAAADLVADTFVKALASEHTYNHNRGPLKSWLFGIAAHRYFDWCKEGVRSRCALDEYSREPTVAALGAESEVAKCIRRVALQGELDECESLLSEIVRQTLFMRLALHMPYEEIAARQACTTGAARVRVSRGVAILRHALSDRIKLLEDEWLT